MMLHNSNTRESSLPNSAELIHYSSEAGTIVLGFTGLLSEDFELWKVKADKLPPFSPVKQATSQYHVAEHMHSYQHECCCIAMVQLGKLNV